MRFESSWTPEIDLFFNSLVARIVLFHIYIISYDQFLIITAP